MPSSPPASPKMLQSAESFCFHELTKKLHKDRARYEEKKEIKWTQSSRANK
jgi:hypothetical protein